MTKRKTIREKKVAIIQMLVGSMEKHRKQMIADLEKYKHDKEILDAVLDGHFESLRCSSGNLNLVLEGDRRTLAIMYESTEMDKEAAAITASMQEKRD